MKYRTFYMAILSYILLFSLSACTQGQDVKEQQEVSDSALTENITISTETTSVPDESIGQSLQETTSFDIGMIIPLPPEEGTALSTPVVTAKGFVEQNNVKYHLAISSSTSSIFAITGFESNEQHVIIHGILNGYPSSYPSGAVEGMIIRDNVSIPNATKLTVKDGVIWILCESTSDKLSSIEVLELPSTLKYIVGNRNGSTDFYNTFPLELYMLEEIHVESENEYLYAEDGVLYQIQPRFIYEEEQLLVVIPQNYSCEEQVVYIREGTGEIMNGAIYHCRNIQKILIPDSVVKIGDHAIIATAEHPLTVVCSRDSAAAAYVEKYGEMYHLTVEFTD